jgi:hypothetical protein
MADATGLNSSLTLEGLYDMWLLKKIYGEAVTIHPNDEKLIEALFGGLPPQKVNP